MMGRVRFVRAVLILLAGGLLTVPAGPASATSCSPASTKATTGQSATDHPVIYVHGWVGKPLRQTAAAVANLVPHLSTYEFDYSHTAANWAADDVVAGCLAKYVTDVSQADQAVGGDGKVLVVAHSMGGLAVLYAAARQVSAGHPVSDLLAGVVTLDTPWLGSPFGSTGAAGFLQGIHESLDSVGVPGAGDDAQVCLAPHAGGAPIPPPCTAALPQQLPASVPLTTIAGDVTVQRTIFGATLYSWDLGGDGIVPASSAHGYPTMWRTTARSTNLQLRTVTCDVTLNTLGRAAANSDLMNAHEIDLLARFASPNVDQPSKFMWPILGAAGIAAPCGHSQIVTNPTAAGFVADALRSDIAALTTTAPATQAPAGPVALTPAGTVVVANPAETTVLRPDGSVWAWGFGTDAGPTLSAKTPTRVGGLPPIAALSVTSGGGALVALDTTGHTWVWGTTAPAGDAAATDAVGYRPVELSVPPAVQVSIGDGYGVVRASDGAVSVWTDDTAPVRAPIPAAVDVAAFGNMVWAVDTTGQVWVDHNSTWAQVVGATGVARVDVAAEQVWATRTDGTLLAWGAHTSTEDLGTGVSDTTAPAAVPGPSGVRKVVVPNPTSPSGALILTANGTVWETGTLASDTTGHVERVAVQVPGLPPMRDIGRTYDDGVWSSNGVSWAVTADGQLFGWGQDHEGDQGLILGHPLNVIAGQVLGPQKVTGVPVLAGVFTTGGNYRVLVQARDGAVWTWGTSADDKLGLGDVGAAGPTRPAIP